MRETRENASARMTSVRNYEIAERYCAHVDGNVILTRINEDASEPPRYRCLSSHLCADRNGEPCRHAPEEKTAAFQ